MRSLTNDKKSFTQELATKIKMFAFDAWNFAEDGQLKCFESRSDTDESPLGLTVSIDTRPSHECNQRPSVPAEDGVSTRKV